ncbi:predicted protein [Sclerotinia sclerotiorum 1980 UF-70]|uniref:Uncharacterized protein n=1 Tax=Sclerotinia sclerotiorum (strain ATCC 18683 / 1980 / Ss-1) TaxID=665079 RepID=A7F703_SCLS1|nr:predicted protein [Sclerotinia sclerotiorum 1980 UF-70]EDN98524.1 predicted protein [Sclerotinia sclerotiorum 1980 UF-70]
MYHRESSQDEPLWMFIIMYITVSMVFGIVVWWTRRSRRRGLNSNGDEEQPIIL